jgi:hypothetical protein
LAAGVAPFLVLASIVLGVFVSPPLARGDEQAPRLLILRSGEEQLSGDLSKEVDEQLTQALIASGFGSPFFSPTSFEEVELAAGCSGPTAECLRRMSGTVNADWILVRKLEREKNGALVLLLVAQDGADSVLTRRAVGRVTAKGAETPARVVPELVHMLYPIRATVGEPHVALTAPAPNDERAPKRKHTLSVAGWTMVATAGALLTSGLAVGLVSARDSEQYRQIYVHDAQSARQAASLYDQAKTRSNTANGLLIGGAVLAGAGGALLVWDVVRRRDDGRSLRVALRPARSGAMFTLAGTFRGSM